MTLWESIKTASLTLKLVAALVLVVLVTALIVWSHHLRNAAADTKNRVETGQHEAATKSGQDAVGTVGNVSTAQQRTDNLTRNSAGAIDRANGSSARVSDEVQRAGLKALCARPDYKEAADCAQYNR